MPTYDYLCEACGARIEIFQSMKESAKRKCPECGQLKLRRQIGTELGIFIHPIRVRDNLLLGANDYLIKLKGVEIARATLMPDHLLAVFMASR